MTLREADNICRHYYNLTNPGEEDRFIFTEALEFVIRETDDPDAMNTLGAMYYEQRRFDLALKYYQMAAERGDLYAITNLSYIWYYGRTGERDYEKAFYYYDKGRQLGDVRAAYKIADMYKNGYYVSRDIDKYKAIIRGLYPKVCHARDLNEPLPEIFTRLARIEAEEGNAGRALQLYDRAKDFLAQRIRAWTFFGDLNIMQGLIEDVHDLRGDNMDDPGLYDLYVILRRPVTVRFFFEGDPLEVSSVQRDGQMAVCFDGHWYRSIRDFFEKAELEGEKLTTRYDELYDFEVI